MPRSFPVRPASVCRRWPVLPVAVFLVLSVVAGRGALAAPTARTATVALRCNYQDRPLGIDTPQPQLSWQTTTGEQSWLQTAYRILVATKPSLLAAGQADVWDSGRQASADSVNVSYGGPRLQSRQRYFWTVQVWGGKAGASATSAPSWWEMGLLQPSDWTAQWIAGTAPKTDDVQWIWLPGINALAAPPKSSGYFRYSLQLTGRPVRAQLSIAAHRSFVVTVNGKQTGRKQDWSTFDVEDIADALHAGSNEIRVMATAPAARAVGGTPAPPSVTAGMTAVLSYTDASGETHRVTAGSGWQASTDGDTWTAAQTIAALNDPRMGQDPGLPPSPAALLRDSFSLTRPVRQARLYITAAGSYLASINGRRVSPDELTPGFTDFRKRLLYQTYDVGSLLKPGTNVIGTILGDGWYGSGLTWEGAHLFPAPVRLLAQLEVEFQDGSRQVFGTSSDWTTSASAILSSDIYGGEHYDARLEQPGWDQASFVAPAERWSRATAAAAPAAPLSAQLGTPVRQTQVLQPRAVKQLPNGDAVFDMGQNMVGWVTLHASGRSGTTVRLRFAERLNPDGSIYTQNLRNADAEDIATLRGGGPETFTPHFTFHGFQYVQVSGLVGKATVGMLTGNVLNSLGAEPAGKLQTSSALLNRMWQIGIWGQRGNFVSIPTDCPQRDERLGWMGDAGVFWRTGAYNFDIAAFSRKFMQDIVDAQEPSGAYTNVSPNVLGADAGAPGWGDAGIIVPFTAWLQYGDASLLRQHWDSMERWMRFIEADNPNYLREKGTGPNYADWLAPDQHTPTVLVGTAYWALVARMMQIMAHATGHDEAKYATLFNRIRSSYENAFVSPDGKVAGDTQSAYLLTLYTGLAPESLRASMTDRLVANVNAHDGHLTTGFLGTPFLLFALSDNHRTDAAYKLLLQTTYPSWGYMIAKGATTWWERWNGDTGDPAMNSYNHYSFGSVVAWIYRDVAGIDADPDAPGFRHILIHPHWTPELTFAAGQYDSVYGRIATRWNRSANGIQLSVTVPPNATATVMLDPLPGVADQTPRVVRIGSGTYSFHVSPSVPPKL